MPFLLILTFVAAVSLAAAKEQTSDDNACAASGEDVDQVAEGHSMIHRHSIRQEGGGTQQEISHLQAELSRAKRHVHELTQELQVQQEAKLHRDFSERLSHRHSRDNFLLQLVASNLSREEVDMSVLELHNYLDALGFPDFGKEGHVDPSGVLGQQVAKYDEWANLWNFKTICETGFNGGDSALRFLSQTEAHVFEFDLCEHGYTRPSAEFLNKKFPDRLHLNCGNSKLTLPEFRKKSPEVKCDVVIIDGGHDLEVAVSDLQNLAMMAHEHALVVMDDAPCAAQWCQGPTTAWKQFVADGCIETSTEVPMTDQRGFTYGLLKPCGRLQQGGQ